MLGLCKNLIWQKLSKINQFDLGQIGKKIKRVMVREKKIASKPVGIPSDYNINVIQTFEKKG